MGEERRHKENPQISIMQIDEMREVREGRTREGRTRERVSLRGRLRRRVHDSVRGSARDSVRGRVRVREREKGGQVHYPASDGQHGEKYTARERRRNTEYGESRGLAESRRASYEVDNSPTRTDEGWVEVSHRRKKKTAVDRGPSVLNKRQRQHRRGTWRDKEDVTSFYFSRFPDGVNEKNL